MKIKISLGFCIIGVVLVVFGALQRILHHPNALQFRNIGFGILSISFIFLLYFIMSKKD